MKTLNKIRDNYITKGYMIFFCLMIFLGESCRDSESRTYIISKEDSVYKAKYTRNDGIVVTPPIIPYGEYNFLVDSNYHYYFYGLPSDSVSGFVRNDIEYRNKLIGLATHNVFSIPFGQEEKFFEINVRCKNALSPRNIVIASARDTLVGDFITFLKKLKTDSLSKCNIIVRRLLIEEQQILNTRSHFIKGDDK